MNAPKLDMIGMVLSRQSGMSHRNGPMDWVILENLQPQQRSEIRFAQSKGQHYKNTLPLRKNLVILLVYYETRREYCINVLLRFCLQNIERTQRNRE